MKTDEYVPTTNEDEARERADAMQMAMPQAVVIYEKFRRAQDKLGPEKRLHLDIRAVKAARDLWERAINPFIATNDASHPNNWNAHQILKYAGIIQAAFNLPMYEKDAGNW